MSKLEPKLWTVLKEGYSKQMFFQDLSAGVLVGIVALPLAIAFAIASGVKPEQGLYTAIVAGFLISFLGGSRVQIGGPTGAFVVIVAGIMQQYGYDGLAVATFMAGFFLILMGLLRLGSVIRFIPHPVTVGFTSGIAVIIFTSQIKDFLGLQIENFPAEFFGKIEAYIHSLHTINPWALGIGVLSFLIIVFWPKVSRKIPGSLVAILATTIIVQLFQLPVETIGQRFGHVPNTLPVPRLPHISWEIIQKMFSPAVTIALLAGIESLLSAVVADGMMGTRHRSNMELIAQGIANIASPLFQGIPATGAIARTATNIKNGGRTPVAGMIHALTLLLILLFFGKWAELIPLATLAAVLMKVAINMSEYEVFLSIFKTTKSDISVLLTTFLLTVFIDLTVAIEVGIVLAALLFMYRMAHVTEVSHLTEEISEEELQNDTKSILLRDVPKGVEVFEIQGSLFFGAAETFKSRIRNIQKTPKVLVLRMRHVYSLDATGLAVLEDLWEKCSREKIKLIFSGVHAQPLDLFIRSGLADKIGRDNLYKDIDDALAKAKTMI
ncbi:SulP family inorganic anion transporter [Thermospira aquatica]|uniref:Sulfate permease n=1 Tax=Thermospira aquatica TaxID=2828656 RepID=A0AAX3BC00_9SPIR|nr:sulfate permease [Thermospira aquatica]URA09842.1 sulfate permease [Thermospira aquatica]